MYNYINKNDLHKMLNGLLKDKIISTIGLFHKPTSTYTSPLWQSEGNKSVTRTVDIFQNLDSNIVMYHDKFKNIHGA